MVSRLSIYFTAYGYLLQPGPVMRQGYDIQVVILMMSVPMGYNTTIRETVYSDGFDTTCWHPKSTLQYRYRLAASPRCTCLKPDEVRGRARFDTYESLPVKSHLVNTTFDTT